MGSLEGLVGVPARGSPVCGDLHPVSFVRSDHSMVSLPLPALCFLDSLLIFDCHLMSVAESKSYGSLR